MDKVSRIDGKEYTLIEQLPALVGEAGYVICEDTEGKRFVCPEELWLENASTNKANFRFSVNVIVKVCRIRPRGDK